MEIIGQNLRAERNTDANDSNTSNLDVNKILEHVEVLRDVDFKSIASSLDEIKAMNNTPDDVTPNAFAEHKALLEAMSNEIASIKEHEGLKNKDSGDAVEEMLKGHTILLKNIDDGATSKTQLLKLNNDQLNEISAAIYDLRILHGERSTFNGIIAENVAKAIGDTMELMQEVKTSSETLQENSEGAASKDAEYKAKALEMLEQLVGSVKSIREDEAGGSDISKRFDAQKTGEFCDQIMDRIDKKLAALPEAGE